MRGVQGYVWCRCGGDTRVDVVQEKCLTGTVRGGDLRGTNTPGESMLGCVGFVL